VLVHRFFRKDRAVMFELAGKLDLVATSSDASVLAALEHARAYHAARRDHIPLPPAADGGAAGSGIAFASGNWRRAVTDRRHPGVVARRHFEAMVFTYLAEELRTGDIAITGAGEYADWRANLLPWEECEPLLEGFCAGVGLPATAAGFTERLRHAHLDAAGALDAGYGDNADLVIGEDGVPALKRRRSAGTPQAAERLKEAVERRMPERSLLSIVARTAYWLGWHHHFGPASGSDPKISDPLSRYCMAVFTGGINIGPYEAARHIAGVSAWELSMVRNRHIDLNKLNTAIATVVNAFAELDVVKAWGDGTAVAADGTQVETYIDNLLAETSIRYGTGVRRDRLPARLQHLHRPVQPLHPLRGVGGGLHHRGPAQERQRHPARHDPRRYAGPVAAGLRPRGPAGVRLAAPHPELARPGLLPAGRGHPLPAHRLAVSGTSRSTGT
jgi:hypothetical protein